MERKSYVGMLCAFALCSAGLFGQTVASSIVGTVVDPSDSAVVGAQVTLTNTGTGAVRTATTDSLGTYRFVELDPGIYNLAVKATGFKSETMTGLEVVIQETHNAGRTILQLGNLSESVTVTAVAAQVQTESSELSQTVDAGALNDLTLKGRDLFGYPRLVPGVIDTSTSRDVTSHGAISGMSVNGNPSSTVYFSVDGIADMDIGSSTSLQVEPNLDSIEELKVLTSNFAAEYGRNSGGMITVVTKSGTQDFHGSAAWNHRHEEFNADTWVNNHTIKNGVATPRVPYRYNVESYGIGGPVYIPKHFNRDKTRLFFFWSQEYTGQFVSGGSESMYTPTALERAGNFSASLNNNGSLIKVLDPANNNVQFPNNIIPASRLNPVGQELLNFFPSPNYTPVLAAQLNVVNYFEQASGSHPRRNDVLRIDGNMTSKVAATFRWMHDYDTSVALYDGVQFTSDVGGTLGQQGIAPINHPNGGQGYMGKITYTISPTMVNEASIAVNWDMYNYIPSDNYKSEDRSLVPGLPVLFPVPTAADDGPQSAVNGYQNILPTFSFGSNPSNAMSYGRTGASAGQEISINPTWYFTDNINKVVGHHALKAGVYLEYNLKYQPSDRNYAGAFSFASSTSVPLLNTNDGFANALLGNVSSYSQYNVTTSFNVNYWNAEFYLQDNWKVNRRLTLNLGVRFYHQTPQQDYADTFENFNPSVYSASAMSRIYVPACSNGAATCTSNNGLVAKDPGSGATTSSGFIGDFVPNSGNPTSGMQVLGVNGVPLAPYHQKPLVAAPRVGFAYDVTGDGKTAVRGGWGLFFNRLDGNEYYNLSGQPPIAYQQTVSNLSFAQIAAQDMGAPPSLSSLSVAPTAPTAWPANVPWDAVMNASFDIQRSLGSNFVFGAGYLWSYSYNQHLSYNANWIPIGTGWPFTASNLNPTTAGSTSADIGSIFERTKYPGYGAITENAMIGHDNYNALTATMQKRLTHGLVFGLSYTLSKAMGTTSYTPAVANNENWNYGRLSTDRRNNLQINYYYDLPNVAKKYGIKVMGAVTDHWTFSGITSIQSGAPFNPSCGLTSGSASVSGGYTGTPDVTQRCLVIGNPLANIPAGTYFNPAAYAMPALATGPDNSIVGPPALGDQGGGAGALTYPHVTNFDLTMTKNIPLGNDKRLLRIQVQAYNAFNHPQFNALNTGIQFNPTTNAVSNGTAVGLPTGTLPARVLAFSARLQF